MRGKLTLGSVAARPVVGFALNIRLIRYGNCLIGMFSWVLVSNIRLGYGGSPDDILILYLP